MEELVDSSLLTSEATTTTATITTSSLSESSDIDDDKFVHLVKQYIQLDNVNCEKCKAVKNTKKTMNTMKGVIIAYMVKRSIPKIPTKRHGEEFLELKHKSKNRKPTRDEMVDRLRMLLQHPDTLDKSPEEIVDAISIPVALDETFELTRKKKRGGNRAAAAPATSIDEVVGDDVTEAAIASSQPIGCLRELMVNVSQHQSSETGQPDYKRQRRM